VADNNAHIMQAVADNNAHIMQAVADNNVCIMQVVAETLVTHWDGTLLHSCVSGLLQI